MNKLLQLRNIEVRSVRGANKRTVRLPRTGRPKVPSREWAVAGGSCRFNSARCCGAATGAGTPAGNVTRKRNFSDRRHGQNPER